MFLIEAKLCLSWFGVPHFRPNSICPDSGCPIPGQTQFVRIWGSPISGQTQFVLILFRFLGSLTQCFVRHSTGALAFCWPGVRLSAASRRSVWCSLERFVMVPVVTRNCNTLTVHSIRIWESNKNPNLIMKPAGVSNVYSK